MKYWLMKSEPSVYSIDDLKKDKKTCWDGIRNYQARNFMMRDMNPGDLAFFYHSNCDVIGIYGVMSIYSKSYADHSAFDKFSKHYDPTSTKEHPRWFMVDVKFERKLHRIITLGSLKEHAQKELLNFRLLAKGNRLSIIPIEEKEWKFILSLGE